uniref:Product n=1 Tax=Onchocerca flexuosa TaxID=387005 RepID=A0A183HLV0_9BILA
LIYFLLPVYFDSFLQNSGIKQTVALNPPSIHQPITTVGYQLADPVFGSQNERSGAAQPDQFTFPASDAARSSAVACKIRPHDGTSRIWSDVGISGGFKSDNSDGIKSKNGYFVQGTNVSSHPTPIQHVTEARYQLVNPRFVTHKAATSTSSVQFIPSSDNNAGGIGRGISNFVQDSNVPMGAVRYEMAGPIFITENSQSTSRQFVLPISNTVSSDTEHFIQKNNVIQTILTSTEGTTEPSASCDTNDRGSMPSSPIKENSLLRELHSAPSMDKSIEVMLQENSTECYRFVEQFASTMNSRSNVVSNVISAENEITRIAHQLAQSAGDALRSVDGSNVKMGSNDDNGSAIAVDDTGVSKSVENDTIGIRLDNDNKEMQKL